MPAPILGVVDRSIPVPRGLKTSLGGACLLQDELRSAPSHGRAVSRPGPIILPVQGLRFARC